MTEIIGPPDDTEDIAAPSRLRRWTVGAVAAGLAAVLLSGPLLQILDRANPQIADNGLAVCGVDYCVVQEAMNASGYGATMARLTMTRLSDGEAQALADELAAVLGVGSVPVTVVASLEGPTAGSYDPSRRVITIERPATAWIVVHEMAHVRSAGHGPEFLDTLVELASYLD